MNLCEVSVRRLIGKDEASMVFVSAGVFTMGLPDEEGLSQAHSLHTVAFDVFYLDTYEVTVERYKWFMQTTSY